MCLCVRPSHSLAQILPKLDTKSLVSQLEAYVPSCWAFHFTRRWRGGWGEGVKRRKKKEKKKKKHSRHRKINQTQTGPDWACRSLTQRQGRPMLRRKSTLTSGSRSTASAYERHCVRAWLSTCSTFMFSYAGQGMIPSTPHKRHCCTPSEKSKYSV